MFSNNIITTQDVPLKFEPCPHCGHHFTPETTQCPNCHADLTAGAANTSLLRRRPMTWPVDRPARANFDARTNVILQFLPSGICMAFGLDKPLILGRYPEPGPYDTLSLTGFNAQLHGVSRQHCQLRRHNNFLIVTDLGSTNGTYLNNTLLTPHKDIVATHGDKLILGTLHITLSFSLPSDHN